MALSVMLGRFGRGLTAGVLLSAFAALALALAAPHLQGAGDPATREWAGEAVAWVWLNLGWSLPVFGAVFALYALTLERLRAALREDAPLADVAQADHLTDLWTSLFFGVGVIWTAIGMRGALVEALGAGGAPDGGVDVLRRMVDGGILLALSTTIFGGVGGYLMRAWKAVVAGAPLRRRYEAEARRDLAALRVSVSAIERRLNGSAAVLAGDVRAPDPRETPR